MLARVKGRSNEVELDSSRINSRILQKLERKSTFCGRTLQLELEIQKTMQSPKILGCAWQQPLCSLNKIQAGDEQRQDNFLRFLFKDEDDEHETDLLQCLSLIAVHFIEEEEKQMMSKQSWEATQTPPASDVFFLFETGLSGIYM